MIRTMTQHRHRQDAPALRRPCAQHLCFAIALVIVAVVMGGSPAMAGPSSAPASPEPDTTAPVGGDGTRPDAAQSGADQVGDLYGRGVVAYREGRFDDAEQAFHEAWAIRKSHDIAANLGATELKLGKLRLAAEHLSFAVDSLPASASSDQQARIQQLLEQALQGVAAWQIRVDAADAAITVDGEPRGQTTAAGEVLRLFVEPGTRQLGVEAEGHRPARRTLEAVAGQSEALEISLEPLDGAVGGDSAGQALPLWPVFVGGGAAVVLAGVGVVLSVVTDSQLEDARAERSQLEAELAASDARCSAAPGCEELGSMYDDAETTQLASTAMYVGSAAAAAFTAVYLGLHLSAGDDDPEAGGTTANSVKGSAVELRVLPRAGLDRWGAIIQGRF